MNELRAIVSSFDVILPEEFKIGHLQDGHINDTFRLITGTDKDYLLQRKNHKVFQDVPGMMENIHRVTTLLDEVQKKENHPFIGTRTIKPYPLKGKKQYYYFTGNNYYTLTDFIQGAHSYEQITNIDQAGIAGKAFSSFVSVLEGLKGETVNVTIPRFHDITFRWEGFISACEKDVVNRAAGVRDEMAFYKQTYKSLLPLHKAYAEGQIPQRIIHNDTKINNLLFDAHNKVLCIIDLDTVMPGALHFDYGDAIRTATNTGGESATNIDNITFNTAVFREFTSNYMFGLNHILTPAERDFLPMAPYYMTYLMGIRFLTDYLQGDTYYKITFHDENLVRARSQMKFFQEMQNNHKTITKTINTG